MPSRRSQIEPNKFSRSSGASEEPGLGPYSGVLGASWFFESSLACRQSLVDSDSWPFLEEMLHGNRQFGILAPGSITTPVIKTMEESPAIVSANRRHSLRFYNPKLLPICSNASYYTLDKPNTKKEQYAIGHRLCRCRM